MADPTRQTFSSELNESTSASLAWPSTNNNDLAVLIIAGGTSVGSPTGGSWTQIGSAQAGDASECEAWYLVCDGTETGNITWTSGDTFCDGFLWTFRDADNGTWSIHGSDSDYKSNGNLKYTITGTAAGDAACGALFGEYSESNTTFTVWDTEEYDASSYQAAYTSTSLSGGTFGPTMSHTGHSLGFGVVVRNTGAAATGSLPYRTDPMRALRIR